jgi:hypothetical protein
MKKLLLEFVGGAKAKYSFSLVFYAAFTATLDLNIGGR